jgi:hypothetical protein
MVMGYLRPVCAGSGASITSEYPQLSLRIWVLKRIGWIMFDKSLKEE